MKLEKEINDLLSGHNLPEEFFEISNWKYYPMAGNNRYKFQVLDITRRFLKPKAPIL